MIAYVDSSVLLRFVLDQPSRLAELTRFDERLTSAVTEVECLRAVDASRVSGLLTEDESVRRRSLVFVQLRRMRRLGVSRSVLTRAGESLTLPVKTLDAIHLATALQWRDRRAPDLVFATHDQRLGQAAAALGFPIIGV
jgi:predicted nucleic acid-binding protein